MKFAVSEKGQLMRLTFLFLALLTVAWMLYGLQAYPFIRSLYYGRLPFVADWIMRGRSVTPLEIYLEEADIRMLSGTMWLVVVWAVVLFGVTFSPGKLVGLILFVSVLGLSVSFIAFSVIEIKPGVGDALNLEVISYYAPKKNFVPDEKLAFKQ